MRKKRLTAAERKAVRKRVHATGEKPNEARAAIKHDERLVEWGRRFVRDSREP